ncbi:MAG: ABC transporter ATP-binding protein [Candidatus Schekmanbacteria bacterium]|nr:ABC transporter ATP-binding protein [Candidatus Schekmanbacteria bacterium]
MSSAPAPEVCTWIHPYEGKALAGALDRIARRTRAVRVAAAPAGPLDPADPRHYAAALGMRLSSRALAPEELAGHLSYLAPAILTVPSEGDGGTPRGFIAVVRASRRQVSVLDGDGGARRLRMDELVAAALTPGHHAERRGIALALEAHGLSRRVVARVLSRYRAAFVSATLTRLSPPAVVAPGCSSCPQNPGPAAAARAVDPAVMKAALMHPELFPEPSSGGASTAARGDSALARDARYLSPGKLLRPDDRLQSHAWIIRPIGAELPKMPDGVLGPFRALLGAEWGLGKRILAISVLYGLAGLPLPVLLYAVTEQFVLMPQLGATVSVLMALAIALFARELLGVVRELLLLLLARRSDLRITLAYMRTIMSSNVLDVSGKQSGYLAARLYDTFRWRYTLTGQTVRLLFDVLLLFFVGLAMLVLAPVHTALAAAGFAAMILVARLYWPAIVEMTSSYLEIWSHAMRLYHQWLEGTASIRVDGAPGEMLRRIDRLLARDAEIVIRLNRIRNDMNGWIGGIASVIGVGVALAAALAVTAGTMPIGLFASFAALLMIFLGLAGQVGTLIDQMAQGRMILGRLQGVTGLLRAEEEAELPVAEHGLVRGELRFEQVAFAYPGRPAAIVGLDFAVPPGSSIALVGRTGSGKSTVAGMLARLFDPTQGRICLDGIDLRDWPLHRLRRLIGVMGQESFAFGDFLLANLVYGMESSEWTMDDVWEAVRVAQLEELVRSHPDGLYTAVGERGRGMSRGELARLQLARMLLQRPAVLVLDEPFVGLDAATKEALRAALPRLVAGRTLIMITHDLDVARQLERVVVLDGGRLVEQGTPAELIAIPHGVYATQWRRYQEELGRSKLRPDLDRFRFIRGEEGQTP